MFETILQRIRDGTTTETDAEFLERILNASFRMAESDWSTGEAWRRLAELRAAHSLWRMHYHKDFLELTAVSSRCS